MEQLVLLVVIGLISLINWVLQKAAEKRELAKMERGDLREGTRGSSAPKPPRNVVVRRPSGPLPDPYKELMDALGLPANEPPPPPVVVRTAPVREPQGEFASLEAVPMPSVVAQRKSEAWQPAPLRRPDDKTAQLAYAFTHQVEASAEQAKLPSVRALLSNRASRRQAVVLAEILAEPRGLVPSGSWGRQF
jgi:hypothetical protein